MTMKLKMMKRIGIGAASILLTAGAVTGFAAHASPQAAAESEPISAQIARDVTTAIQKNAESRTAIEWANSGFTPADIFRNTQDLSKRVPEAPDALCSALAPLPDQDLALFDDELAKPETRDLLPCSDELSNRVKAYFAQAKKALVVKRTAEKKFRIWDRGEQLLPRIVSAVLPSEEKPVDVTKAASTSSGGLTRGQIAITFDDGPHPSRTQRILNILAANGVRATFFELGEHASSYPDVSRAVHLAGHTVGSHTVDHAQLSKLAVPKAEDEILNGRSMVETALGIEAPFFRFPFGDRTKILQQFVNSKDMPSFLWNMDTLDWKIRDPNALFKNVLTELNREKGGIILFHDIHEQTVIVLPHVLEELKTRGFTTFVFVPTGRS